METVTTFQWQCNNNKMSQQYSLERVKSLIKAYPDFPKQGILFQDIFPIFQDHQAVQCMIQELVVLIRKSNERVDAIVGLDSRGFLLGPALAIHLNCPFVPVRKSGKLPGDCAEYSYQKEYGVDTFQMQKDSIPSGANVVIFDDLLATGGSAFAAQQLVESTGARVCQFVFIIELIALQGAKRLTSNNGVVQSLFQFED
ncbi:hypothetical protein MIR68_002055 [Amoeboaphelidium protococcarum]|nr:hypothetical protein MIR68_002055 [Amoeboaphelidium protococcarum]